MYPGVQLKMESLQRYLGLLASEGVSSKPAQPDAKSSVKGPTLRPAPYDMASDVVFICVDLEAYEFAQHKITEIGVAVLDTRDLKRIVPGPGAQSWLNKIKTQHLRIEEHKKYVNKRYVKGCPDDFNFGVSEFVSGKQAGEMLGQIFSNPSPAKNARKGKAAKIAKTAPVSSNATANPATRDESKTTAAAPAAISPDARSVVLVGHNLASDIQYLKYLNFSPSAHGRIHAQLDTQTLCGSTKAVTIGLERLVRALGVTPKHLHNAGNDAAYTLQALVLMALQHTERPGSVQDMVATVAPPRVRPQDQPGFKGGKEARKARKLERRIAAGKIGQEASEAQ